VELMGGPAETFAGIPRAEGRGGVAGRRGGGDGRGRGGAPAEIPPGAKMGSWNEVSCVIPDEGAARGGGGGGRGRGNAAELTPEQQQAQAAARAAQEELSKKIKEWRTTVSMDPFKRLRKMYNDAGVSIYAFKQLSPAMSDEEFEYIFNVAEALGATHTTLELPAGENAAAQLKRIGDFAVKKKIYAAYHTHAQGSMTAFDQAFAISKGNMANVDLGHWTAGGNKGGTPMDFLRKYHARTSSFHLKDRTTPEHCALNLPWGTGETPIKEILQLVRRNKWKIPASVEFEYAIPEGSDPVQEVRKCVEYCRAALAT
jgi:sugar phosphate isomerase/epimerase